MSTATPVRSHHFVGRPGHGGTVDNAGIGGRRPGIVCDCGLYFPGRRHPVETDLIESPQWEAHVKQERTTAP